MQNKGVQGISDSRREGSGFIRMILPLIQKLINDKYLNKIIFCSRKG